MVLLLDGNSETGTHVISNLCYLICLRHLVDLDQSQIAFFLLKDLFYFMRAQYVMPYHLIMYSDFSELDPKFLLKSVAIDIFNHIN